MRILMMINGLPMGGAETFFVRLACGLARHHEVRVYLPSLQDADDALLGRLEDARIPVETPCWSRPGVYRWLYKFSLLLQHCRKNFSLVDLLRIRFVRALHRRHRFDAVNAHLCWSERLACDAFAHEPVRVVGSDHGDYRAWMTPDAGDGFARIFARSDALICPSEDNRRVAENFPWRKEFRLHVVRYGLELGVTPAPERTASDTIVFGMVARGIAEKGWAEAVEAFKLVRRKCGARVRLVLVGAGAALDELRSQLDANTAAAVEFAGYQADPAPFVARFDIGLLPTYYASESLPNVIIECLAQHKPVIATRIAGIPEMLSVGDECAGVLIPLGERGHASVSHLAEAMLRFVEDAAFRARCVELATVARERFRMDHCVARYEEILRGAAPTRREQA